MRAAAIAGLFELALAYALVTGLAVDVRNVATAPLRVFGIALPPPVPPPPPPPPTPQQRSREREGAASPPNIKSMPTEIVAPPPRIVIPVPPPIVAAPVAGTGADSSAGAAPVRGPGTGSGGEGNGSGSGGAGNGGGGGGGSPPLFLKGRLKDSDYPRSAGQAGIGGIVDVQYTVGTDGHVRNCRVTRSSGNADLDTTTCRMIVKRYRYRPAMDRGGRPIDSEAADSHEWVIDPVRPTEDKPD